MRIHKLLLIPILVGGLAVTGCTADVEEEGELPDVEVEGGNLPEVDVNAADVEVGTDTQTVVTPDVDVEPPAERPPTE